MKTWKSQRRVCRSRKSGRFTFRGKCKAVAASLIKALPAGKLFK